MCAWPQSDPAPSNPRSILARPVHSHGQKAGAVACGSRCLARGSRIVRYQHLLSLARMAAGVRAGSRATRSSIAWRSRSWRWYARRRAAITKPSACSRPRSLNLSASPIASRLLLLAELYARTQQFERAYALYHRLRAAQPRLWRRRGHRRCARRRLAQIAHLRQELDAAAIFGQEALQLYESIEHQHGLARILCVIGGISYGQGDLLLAVTHYCRSFAICHRLHDTVQLRRCVRGAGADPGRARPQRPGAAGDRRRDGAARHRWNPPDASRAGRARCIAAPVHECNWVGRSLSNAGRRPAAPQATSSWR